MKRLIAIAVLAVGLVAGTAIPAAAIPTPPTVFRGGEFDCAVELTLFGTTVVGAVNPATSPFVAFSSGMGGIAQLGLLARNRACAGASFYDHIGFRELCIQRFFLGWTDNGQIILAPQAPNACKLPNHGHGIPPLTDDVYCIYLNHWTDSPGCYETYWQFFGPGSGGGGSW